MPATYCFQSAVQVVYLSEVVYLSLMSTFHFVTEFTMVHIDYTPAPRRRRGLYCLYTPAPRGGGGYTVLPLSVCLSFRPSKIFFSATIDGRNLIFGHKLHIGMPYCEQRFWTRQIPTSCLPTKLVFIHIEHICTFFVTFFSATIDDTNLIFGHKLHIGNPYRGKRFWTHQIPTSCLPILLIFIHI